MHLNAYLHLIRPKYLLYVGSVTAIASFISHGLTVETIFAVISITLLTAGLFALDDFTDIEADKITHPERPLPSGLIRKRSALAVGLTTIVASVFIVLNLKTYQIGLFFTMITFGFTVIFFKQRSLIRALLASCMIGFLFPFGAFLNLRSIVFGLMIGLPHIGGSIVKDYLHAQGDSLQGIPLPPTWMKHLAVSIFFISGIVVWIPVILHLVSWLYAPLILVTCLCCWILCIRLLKGDYLRVYTLGGIAMTFTLIAFIVSSF